MTTDLRNGLGQREHADHEESWIHRPAALRGAAVRARAGAGRAAGSYAASDAFFPFPDGLEILTEAGVKAVVQPGGSVRDELVVEAAKKAGVTMYFTGTRHFFH